MPRSSSSGPTIFDDDAPGARSAGLVAKDSAGDNAAPLSVSEISAQLKRTVEDRFGFVRVRGELSGVKRAASGHVYLCLKDEGARLDGVLWRGTAQRLSFLPEDGVEVIATGKLTTYPGRSNYQIVIERMEIAGEGALLALLAKTRVRLEAEGLFAQARKRPLPFLPSVIGVVTSPTGAVIRDILHRLADRFPIRVIVWPVAVQGSGAAEQVAAAVDGFSNLPLGSKVPRPDVVIVARGGGSIEDLWSFNEEIVVRAIAGSSIPVISAVGHETDTTLADFAADLRAPTPTAAAELAVPVREDLIAQIGDLAVRKRKCALRPVALGRERLEARVRRVPRAEALLAGYAQRLDDQGERLRRGLGDRARVVERRLSEVASRLSLPVLQGNALRAGERLGGARRALDGALRHVVGSGHRELSRAAAGLRPQMLRGIIRDDARRLGGVPLAPALLARRLRTAGDRFRIADKLLPQLDPDGPLRRGFARVMDTSRHTLTSRAAALERAELLLRFVDGEMTVHTAAGPVAPRATAKPASARPRRRFEGGGGQGDLF